MQDLLFASRTRFTSIITISGNDYILYMYTYNMKEGSDRFGQSNTYGLFSYVVTRF